MNIFNTVLAAEMSAEQNDYERYFRELREKEWQLKRNITESKNAEQVLGERRSKNEYKLSQLKEQITILKTKANEMEKRIVDTKEVPQPLKEKRSTILDRNKKAPVHLKWLYGIYVKRILECLEPDLHALLHCLSLEEPGDEAITKEAYKVYGLLLSACPLKSIVKKVTTTVQNRWHHVGPGSEEIINGYAFKAVDLTYRMLTLLPPLLVTTHLKEYKEQCHDTNRLTWNEGAVGVKELIYYRPILVYGNQLHVAVKGLVGNSEKEISKEVTDKQPQAQSLATSSEHDKYHTGGKDGSATAHHQSSV